MNIIKSFVLIIFFECLFALNVSATIYQTISSGFWSNIYIWQNGVAPTTSTSDTIIISHFIEFNSSLEFLPNAYLKIEGTGSLCGHDTITFNSNTLMHCYGIFECDICLVPGGHINFLSSAHVIWTQYAFLSNGASMSSAGATINVGPWFYCLEETSGIEEQDQPLFCISGESGHFIINRNNIYEYFITDMSGRIVMRNNSGDNNIFLSGFKPGFYIISVKCIDGVFRERVYVD